MNRWDVAVLPEAPQPQLLGKLRYTEKRESPPDEHWLFTGKAWELSSVVLEEDWKHWWNVIPARRVNLYSQIEEAFLTNFDFHVDCTQLLGDAYPDMGWFLNTPGGLSFKETKHMYVKEFAHKKLGVLGESTKPEYDFVYKRLKYLLLNHIRLLNAMLGTSHPDHLDTICDEAEELLSELPTGWTWDKDPTTWVSWAHVEWELGCVQST